MGKGRGVEEVLYSIPAPEQRAVAPKFLDGHHNPHTGLFYAGVKDFFQSFCWLQPQYQGQYGEDIKQCRLKNVALHIYQTYRILNRQDGKQLLTLVSYKGQEHMSKAQWTPEKREPGDGEECCSMLSFRLEGYHSYETRRLHKITPFQHRWEGRFHP